MQMVVKFRGHLFKFRKTAARNHRKIVMFVVIPYIIEHLVPWTIIGIGFLVFVKYIVFGDKMTGRRMKASCKEKGK